MGGIKLNKEKNWTGNKNSVWATLGASNHTEKQREQDDYYATEPKATELLLELEEFDKNIWEPAAGEGHISKVLEEHGYNVRSTDLVYRGYGEQGDFFKYKEPFDGSIVTNPPYKYCTEFVEHALELVTEGNKVAMLLKLQFLESSKRAKLLKKYPPKKIWVSSRRLLCAKNADFERMRKGGGSAICYCWFIWEKGYTGETVIDIFNYQ